MPLSNIMILWYKYTSISQIPCSTTIYYVQKYPFLLQKYTQNQTSISPGCGEMVNLLPFGGSQEAATTHRHSATSAVEIRAAHSSEAVSLSLCRQEHLLCTPAILDINLWEQNWDSVRAMASGHLKYPSVSVSHDYNNCMIYGTHSLSSQDLPVRINEYNFIQGGCEYILMITC